MNTSPVAACIINKNVKLIKESDKTKEKDCYVIKSRNIAYATLKAINNNNGVTVYLAGVVDYNEQENKCYFDDTKASNNFAVIKMTSSYRDDPEREASIYQLLHEETPHPSIVQLLGGYLQCPNTGEKCIILECMDMDLLQYAEYRKLSWFTIFEAQVIFKQIVTGLSHMHRKGVVHRDLGLENICIKKDNNNKNSIKLMDFGHSIVCNNGVDKHIRKHTKVIRIKPCYDAPELSDASVEFYCPDKCDVWSLGVILFILLVGEYPFTTAPKSQEIITESLHCLKDKNKVDSNALDLLNGMLSVDPKERLTLRTIAEHPWVAS